MKFSDRIGITAPRATFQKEEMDKPLRNRLWSAFYTAALDHNPRLPGDFYKFVKPFWTHFLKRPVDEIPLRSSDVIKSLKYHFFDEAKWFGVYNIIEYTAKREKLPHGETALFIRVCDVILKQEMSAYRFVGNQLVPLTGEGELAAVQDALDETRNASKLSGIHKHLASAVEKFGTRPTGDYVNAIKESISAVEAAVRVITGTNATLGQGLKLLRSKGVTIHPALEQGFDKIYGYTSDADGIRHGMTGDSQADLYEEAKFMLPACSAFVNYLLGKAAGASIL